MVSIINELGEAIMIFTFFYNIALFFCIYLLKIKTVYNSRHPYRQFPLL